jgi:4-amino-4-deoxy-L-arabinose transferase-like glycosyltransferase
MKRILKIIFKTREWLVLCLVLCLAYYLRILGIQSGLPYTWHIDEPQVLHTALRILKTGDYNPHFFHYPTLIIYFQTLNAILCYFHAIGHQLLSSLTEIVTNSDAGWCGTISHPVFYEWGRRLTVIFGTLSVGIVYVICSRFYSSLSTALLAALFLACNLAHLYLSRWITVDVPTAFFVLATAFSSIFLMLKGEKKHYIITGLLAGLSVSAKYNTFPVIILALLGHILNKKKNNLFSPHVFFFFVTIPLGFMLGCPYAFGDLRAFLNDAGWDVYHYKNYGEKITIAQQLIFYYQAFCEDRWALGGGGGVGTFTLYSSFLGMISGFFINWRLHLLLLSFPLAYVWYMSTMQIIFMRNMVAVNAFLCIFSALFLCQFFNFASALLKKKNVPAANRNIYFSLAFILCLINPVYRAINWSIEEYTAQDSRVLAVEWMEKNVKRPQKVAFAEELKWFSPALDKLGFEHVLIGQLEKDPVWFWNEDFDYVVAGNKYLHTAEAPNLLFAKYNQSFFNMTRAQSFGASKIIFGGYSVNPKLDIVAVDANFYEPKYWKKNWVFFDFNLDEFKGNLHRNKLLADDKTSWEIKGTFCSPKVIFEEGSYEVEITAYGSSATGAFPLMRLESLKWKDGIQVKIKNEILGDWQVDKEKIFRSGVFHCKKGNVVSFNIIFLNDEEKSQKGDDRKLFIKQIVVRKKG